MVNETRLLTWSCCNKRLCSDIIFNLMSLEWLDRFSLDKVAENLVADNAGPSSAGHFLR